jgi:hypothetical protein
MRIEQLTDDYLYSTYPSHNFTEYFVEAPAMFKRNGIYYVLFGYPVLKHNTQHHNTQHHNTQHHNTQHHNTLHHNTLHHNTQHNTLHNIN